MKEKVSICVPTYNNVEEVDRLLQSVYGQSFRDFGVYVSDDSTNEEIANLIKDKYGSVNYCHNDKPLGHIFNWNAALAMGQGEYIKIMFSDDWFTTKDSLEKLVKLLEENPQADMAFCGSRQVNLETGKWYDRHADEAFLKRLQEDYRLLFLGNQIGAPSAVLYRRKDGGIRFDEKSNWASDMFLYFDLLRENPSFAYTKEPLISIGVHENQYTETFSEQDERIYLDYQYMYEKYQLANVKACRSFFLEKYFIPFRRSYKEVRKLEITLWEYLHHLFANQRKTVICFVKNRWVS